MTKIDESLFSVHEHALDKTHHICPECGGELVMRHSKAGSFLGCSNYPHCEFSQPIHEHGILKQLDDSECPECGGRLALKQGRFGLFVGCCNFPNCTHHQPIEATENTDLACPSCKEGSLNQRKSRYGKTFFACSNYPDCKYAINSKPVAGTCSFCGFELLTEKSHRGIKQICCANKSCGKPIPC